MQKRYIIQSVIGKGGFGILYCAFDMLLNSVVAVKEFFAEGCMERDAADGRSVVCLEQEQEKIEKSRSDFLREIEIMKALHDVPYLSSLRDHFHENGTEYIVMNLLKGESLLSYVKKHGGTVSPAELFPPLEKVLIALEKMHEKGFLHRDISPANLFFTEDGDLYLIDFGTATAADPESELWNPQFFEHKGLQAPEYRELSKQGTWTDIYSLCATVFYLITGEGVPDPEERRRQDRVPQMLMNRMLSSAQQNALIRGLQVEIDRRYASAAKLRAALYKEVVPAFFSQEVSYGACTDIGARAVNQDNIMLDGLFYFEGKDFLRFGKIQCQSDELHMAAVCDGVGGAAAGELASRAAVQAFNHFLEQYRRSGRLPERLIEELMDQLNEKIISLGRKIGKTGTTASFLLWKGSQYYAVNIGDSPIYLLRKRKLELLSTAHTLAAKREMEGMPIFLQDRHTLVNYLGKEGTAGSRMMAYRHGYLKQGDTFLLCSDGVSNKISKDRLKRILSKPETRAITKIYRILGRTQNNDNGTAVVLKF